MKISKLIKILLVLVIFLAVFVAIYFYQQVPHGQTPFLKAVDRSETMTLMQGSQQVHLRKANKSWEVSASQGPWYTADPEKVKTLLAGLHDVRVEDVISEQADRGDYELSAASGTRVTLFGPGQKTLADGFFGKQAPDFAHIYFRFPDRPQVYLARNMIRGELVGAALNEWRDRTLIDWPEAKVESVTIEGPGFTTSLARSSDTWTLDGKKIDPAPVYTLLGTLAHLKADDFVVPSKTTVYSYDMLRLAKITARTADRSLELCIGAEYAPTKRYPVAVAPDSGIAWLYESKVNSLLVKPSSFKSPS